MIGPIPNTSVRLVPEALTARRIRRCDAFSWESRRRRSPKSSVASSRPGTVGQPYSVQLEAVGGTPPYTWSKYPLKGMGTLPRGVTLSKSGLISGIPKRAGTYTFVVRCLDSSHSHKTQVTQALTLTINP